MSFEIELEHAELALANGWIDREQFEEIRLALHSSPKASAVQLLEERFGIDRSRFAAAATVVDRHAEQSDLARAAFAMPEDSIERPRVAGVADSGETVASHSSLSDRPFDERGFRLSPRVAEGAREDRNSAATLDLPSQVPHDLGMQPTHAETGFERPSGPETVVHSSNVETFVAPALPASPHRRVEPIGRVGAGLSRDRYTLTRLHARGGIGQVWLARDTALGREVALKELRPEQAPNETAAARFLEEAQITGQLEHPGIVPVYELRKDSTDDRPYYTMRFIRGGTLEQAIRDYHEKRASGTVTALDRAVLLNAFVGVCNAVDYAHSRGVIHRDLKGQNVVLGDYGEVMVLDWGLAKVVGTEEADRATGIALAADAVLHAPTLDGQIQGTPAYMAPEQAEGRVGDIDFRTDVYGLGAILYEILTGRPPFTGNTTHELLHRVSHDQPPAPRSIDPTIPRALQEICSKALAKSRSDRYPTARELALDVKRWLADEPVSAYREPWSIRLGRWMKRRRSTVAAAAVVLIISTAALGITSVLVGRARDAAVVQRRQARAAVDDMYSKVADQWLEDRLDPVQADFLRKALAYYESFTADDGTEPSIQLERGRAQLRLADVLRKLGRHAEAQTAYRRAIDLLGPLAASGRAGVRHDPLETESLEPRDDDAAAHLALARTRLAASFAESGRYAEADALAREALLTPLGSSASGALIEGRTLRLLAEIERATGRPKEAEATFGRALERLADLTRNFDDVEPRYESALAQDGLGLVLRESSRPSEALAHYRDAAAILKALVDRAPNIPRFRVGLAKVDNSLGLLLDELGETEESEKVLRRQVAINTRLAEDFPDRPNYRRTLARAQINLAIGLASRGDEKTAEEFYREALATNEKLASEYPDVPEYRRDQARCLNNIGQLLIGRAQFTDAALLLSRAKGLYEALSKEHADVPGHRAALAAALVNIALCERSLGKGDQALANYRAAGELLEELVAKYPDHPDYLRSRAKALENLGNLLASRREFVAAETAYAKAIESHEDLVKRKLDQESDQLELSQLLSNQGLNRQGGRLPGAETALARAEAIAERLAAARPESLPYRRQLAVARINHGESLVADGRFDQAERAIDAAISGYEGLTAEQPKSAEFWTEMAVAIGDKADLEFRRDRVENATALHRRAVAANRTAAALNPRSTPTRTALRAQLDSLARTLVAARDHSGAAGVVEELVQLTPTAPGVRESAARVLAQCAEIAANDPKLEPKQRPILVASYADRAISLLRDGILRGEVETGKIRGDHAFDRLKSRESFQTLGGVAAEGDRTGS